VLVARPGHSTLQRHEVKFEESSRQTALDPKQSAVAQLSLASIPPIAVWSIPMRMQLSKIDRGGITKWERTRGDV
jgi:hypothetical protein